MKRMKTLFLTLLAVLSGTIAFAGENDLLWDYTNAAPTSNPDNGLYYGSIVNDAAGTNLGLKGIKLNSSGWAYFEKAPVAGTLKLVISNRKNTSDYKANVSRATKAAGASPVKGDLIAVTDAAQGPTVVSIELDETVTGIYIDRNTPAEGVLSKVEFIEKVPRSFTDFELNFMNCTTLPETPEGVVTMTGSPRGDSHGLDNFQMEVNVDGPIKFTIGGCQFSNTEAVIKNSAGQVLASVDVKTPGCYHNGGKATFVYAGGAETLTIVGAQYTPYIKAEAIEIKPATLTYMDPYGVKLAVIEKQEGDAVGEVPDSVLAKLHIPKSMKLRGWKYSSMKLAQPSDLLTGNTVITAHATREEFPTMGTHYKYNLNSPTDYMSDHDLITSDGSFHDGTHGWVFNNGNTMTLIVSPKAYVSVGLCQYTAASEQTITNADGEVVATMLVDASTTDGKLCSFYNERATIDTLCFNFTATTYIHFVEVYNVAAPLSKVGNTFDVAAGDAAAFMLACSQLQDGDVIQLHDGIYDLGETVLTTISANNVTVKGETMNETIIRNAPNAKTESINNTATILNAGNGNVFEKLTLRNDLDYYLADNGRAVCLQDKGTKTACYEVKMLSYQDTYYSNKPGQQCYFEDCEIHGTVDYICGSGSVYFYNCLLYNEKRSRNGGGQDCMTASNAQISKGDKGYVFDRCTVKSECPVVSLGRAWNDQPQVAYLFTTLDKSAGEFSLTDNSKIFRWTLAGMNVCAYEFAEYHTMNTDGEVVSPQSNKLNFTHNTGNKEIETIIDYAAAEAKSYSHFFTDWNPARNYVPFPAEPTVIEPISTISDCQNGKQFCNGKLTVVKNGFTYNINGIQVK